MAELSATPAQWSTRATGRSRAPLVTRLGGQGSQRAAQQETLPLIACAVHVGGLVRDQHHTRDDRRSGGQGLNGAVRGSHDARLGAGWTLPRRYWAVEGPPSPHPSQARGGPRKGTTGTRS